MVQVIQGLRLFKVFVLLHKQVQPKNSNTLKMGLNHIGVILVALAVVCEC